MRIIVGFIFAFTLLAQPSDVATPLQTEFGHWPFGNAYTPVIMQFPASGGDFLVFNCPGGTLSLNQINPAPATLTLGVWSVVPPGGTVLKCTSRNLDSGQTLNFQVSIAGPGTDAANTAESTLDPVSTATGELYESVTDLSLGGPLPLAFRRYYGSLVRPNGVTTKIGNNWLHNFEWILLLNGTVAQVVTDRAKVVTFFQNGNAWQLPLAEKYNYQLVTGSNRSYQFLDPSTNLIYTFSGTGTVLGLSQIQDRNGNTLTITQPAGGSAQVSDGLGRTLTFTYDPATGNVMKVADQTGRAVSFTYANGNLTQATNANGKTTTYAYTSAGTVNGLLTGTTLPLGNTPFKQTFDNLGRVATQSDSRSNTTALTYDQPAGTTSYKDPLGAITTDSNLDYALFTGLTDADKQSVSVTYDNAGRRTSVTDRLGNKTTITYHSPSGFPATITDALGNTTTFTYTAQTQGSFTFYVTTKIQYADGSSVTRAYDASGNLTSVTDASGYTTKYTYNNHGQVISATNGGRVTTYAYAGDGTIASVTDPSGNVTTYTYDAAKRVTQIKFADGSTRSFTYDNLDNILKETDERGKTTTFAYDDNDRIQSETDALGKSATTIYTSDEEIQTRTDRTGAATSFTYNELGLLKSTTLPAGEIFSRTYDAQHRLATAVDGAGHGITYAYDKEGGVIAQTDALNRKVTFSRDALGRVIKTTTPSSAIYMTAYDKMNRVTSITDPTNRATTFTYSPGGNLATETIGDATVSFTRDASGGSTVIDPMGNSWISGRTSRVDPLNRTTSFSFDKRGRVSSVQTPIGTVALTYDPAGNLTRGQFSDATDLAFTYDDDNRLLTAPGIALAYDAEGRITSSNGLAVTRDANGRIASITYATGKSVTYTYNSTGDLASVSDWVGGATTFAYDAAHQLMAIKRANGSSTNFTHDQDGRIASIKEDAGSSIAIQRDAAGRVISETRTQPTSANIAPGVLPLSYDAASQVAGFTYDGMGRVTADSVRTYTWNMASRLTGYSGAGGSMTAAYDALGLRTSANDTSFTWNYATSLPTLAVAAAGSGNIRYYVYTPTGILLHMIDAASNTRRFYHFDETGSTVMLTDDSGAVTDSYGITPYGETVTHSGPSDNPFTWQGAFGVMQEGSTGLYYMRHRYYDSTAARFLSPDPEPSDDPLGINPYQFARMDPVNAADPTGLRPRDYAITQVPSPITTSQSRDSDRSPARAELDLIANVPLPSLSGRDDFQTDQDLITGRYIFNRNNSFMPDSQIATDDLIKSISDTIVERYLSVKSGCGHSGKYYSNPYLTGYRKPSLILRDIARPLSSSGGELRAPIE